MNRTWISSENVAFDAVLNGQQIEVRFTRSTRWDHDANHGSDADGNRGWPVTFVDDDYADDGSIRIEGEDGVERIPTTEEAPQVDALVLAYIADNAAEQGEPDGPDPDEYYDRKREEARS